MGLCHSDAFLTAAIEASASRPTLKLTWLTKKPICVEQRLLSIEKLAHLQELVDEQVKLGHLVQSTSPWNTPVFTIQKKSGKWRLLQDLRALNAVMQGMGLLQPGLLSPAMIPEQWDILILDLKDCFFTVPLHPDDCEKFAFTVPAINRASPTKRYQWVGATTRYEKLTNNVPMVCGFGAATFPTISSGTNFVSLHG